MRRLWPQRELPEGSGIGAKRATVLFLVGIAATAAGVAVVFWLTH